MQNDVGTGSIMAEAIPTRTALGGMGHEGSWAKMIEEEVKRPFGLGEIRYLVASKWLFKLEEYFDRNGASLTASDQNIYKSSPGPIDNSPLIGDDGELLADLVPGVDLFLICKKFWNLLVAHHALKEGQTPISRKIIQCGRFTPCLKADLYPLAITLQLDFDSSTETVGEYSSWDTIGILNDLIRSHYQVKECTLSRLWSCSVSGHYDELDVVRSFNTVPDFRGNSMLVLEITANDGQRTFPHESLPMDLFCLGVIGIVQDEDLEEPYLGEPMDFCKWAEVDPSPKSVPTEDWAESTDDLTQEGTPGTPLPGTPLLGTPLLETPLVEMPLLETPLLETPFLKTPLPGTPLLETLLPGTPLLETLLPGTPLLGTALPETPFCEDFIDPTKWPKLDFSPIRRDQPCNVIIDNKMPGVCGLYNLGMSCYMNAAIQCMSNCEELTLFFLERYDHTDKDSARVNWGAKGKIAHAYSALIKKMWSGECDATVATELQMAVKEVNSSFTLASHHDAQEWLLAFMTGLHSDLNKAIKGSIRPVVLEDDRTDQELANDAWERLVQKEDSMVTDTFFGLFRSKLICANCGKFSSTFEPFDSLLVPVVKETASFIKVFLFVHEMSADRKHTLYKLLVPFAATVKDLVTSLSLQSGIPAEQLLITEVNGHRIRRVYDLNEPISSIRKTDEVCAFECPTTYRDGEQFFLVPVCMWVHDAVTKSYASNYLFGYPLLLFLSGNEITHRRIYNMILKKLYRDVKLLHGYNNTSQGDKRKDASLDDRLASESIDAEDEFTLHLLEYDDENFSNPAEISKGCPLTMNTHLSKGFQTVAMQMTTVRKPLMVGMLSLQSSFNKLSTMVHLLDCITFFTTEEKMDDPWKCSACDVKSIPSKKVDLWSLPNSLVIVMKRFGIVGNAWRKIIKAVNIPIELDLSGFVVGPNPQKAKYTLASVCNHIGTVDRGHYTAHAWNYMSKEWYMFDDETCSAINDPKKIVNPTDAYMVVYKRNEIPKGAAEKRGS